MNFGIKASTVRQFLISSGLPSKKAIQIVNQTLNELKVEKHPDKTFIGRIAKGFDFLGYSFEPKGLSIAPKTLANFLERKTQLYEQGATVKRIGQYVRNWQESGWRNVGRNNQSAPASPYPPLCNIMGVAYHLRRRLLKNHIVQNFVWQSLI